jgi:hypothetical protein
LSLAEDVREQALLGMCAGVNPFSRGEWRGGFRSFDGASAQDFSTSDVVEVLCAWSAEDGEGIYGECAAVLRLKDGRFACWETSWEASGDGFSVDGDGGCGDAQIIVAMTLASIVRYGLSEDARRNLGADLVDAIVRYYGKADATLFLQGVGVWECRK